MKNRFLRRLFTIYLFELDQMFLSCLLSSSCFIQDGCKCAITKYQVF